MSAGAIDCPFQITGVRFQAFGALVSVFSGQCPICQAPQEQTVRVSYLLRRTFACATCQAPLVLGFEEIHSFLAPQLAKVPQSRIDEINQNLRALHVDLNNQNSQSSSSCAKGLNLHYQYLLIELLLSGGL